jgi:glycosyltransferase involved in cell wall biosynthesis
MLEVTVIIPTFRRPDQLSQSLLGVANQTRPPTETIVVSRQDDVETRSYLSSDRVPLHPKQVTVTGPGVLEAMAAGLKCVKTPLVAFTDDDAIPRPDWLERLIGYFADAHVGASGGRDLVGGPLAPNEALQDVVGLLTPWGRLRGNHHIGQGPPRDVNVLKAVNCMYRTEAAAIPRNLRGSGAQVHFEVGMGLWTQSRGWRIVYDPQTLVDHYPGPRFDRDSRSRPAQSAVRDAAYNLTFIIASFGTSVAIRRTLFSLVVGDRSLPGLLRALISLIRSDERRVVFQRTKPALSGTLLAAFDIIRGRRLEFYHLPLDE